MHTDDGMIMVRSNFKTDSLIEDFAVFVAELRAGVVRFVSSAVRCNIVLGVLMPFLGGKSRVDFIPSAVISRWRSCSAL
jgi:hypothetical protein